MDDAYIAAPVGRRGAAHRQTPFVAAIATTDEAADQIILRPVKAFAACDPKLASTALKPGANIVSDAGMLRRCHPSRSLHTSINRAASKRFAPRFNVTALQYQAALVNRRAKKHVPRSREFEYH